MNKEMYECGRKYFKKHGNNDEFVERIASIATEIGYEHSLDRYTDFIGVLINFMDGVPLGMSGVSGILSDGYGDRISSFFVGIVHEKDGIMRN